MASPRFLLGRVAIPAVLVAVLLGFFRPRCPPLSAVKHSVVLLTGASSGIGAELAVQYGALGAHLVIAARREAELSAVGEKARAAGAASVLVVPTDMEDAAAVEHLVRACSEAHGGRLDVLFLNHARVDDGLLSSHADARSLQGILLGVFSANLVGSALAARAAMPLLEKSGGHIAVVSSASAKVAAPFHGAYVTSKMALHGYFDTLRSELKLVGSRVSVGLQVLGMIATPGACLGASVRACRGNADAS